MKTKSIENTVLGVDYGGSNIGLALGRNGFSMPLHVISAKNESLALQEIGKITYENKVDKIVMGLPLTAENKETEQSLLVRQFAKKLKIQLKKPVEFVSEYLTSQTALEGSISMGTSQKGRGSIDHIAAAIILKNYYDKN